MFSDRVRFHETFHFVQGDNTFCHSEALPKNPNKSAIIGCFFVSPYLTAFSLPRDISLTLNMTKLKVLFNLKHRVYHKKQATLAASANFLNFVQNVKGRGLAPAGFIR